MSPDLVFLPATATGQLTSGARKEVYEVIAFLHKMKANNRKELVQKAASTLVTQFTEELVTTSTIPKKSVLTNSR